MARSNEYNVEVMPSNSGKNRMVTPSAAARIAAAAGFLAVVLGAFGAHGLKKLLGSHGTADVWEKAVFYHFIHAVMLFILAGQNPFRAFAWWCFLVGIFLFSGSLYLLAVTDIHWLGVITPFGGAAFLLGWGCLIRGRPAADQPMD